MMNVLHVSDYFDPERPGGATRLVHAHLAGLRERGHQVALLAGHPGDAPGEVAPEIPLHAFRYPPNGTAGPYRSFRRIRSLWSAIADGGPPDLVVFHQPLSANAILDLTELAGVPSVYMFHSPWPREHRIAHRGPLARVGAGARLLLERRALSRALRIVTLSVYMREEARKLHPLPEDRFDLIPGGVDLDRFRPAEDRDGLRRRLGVPEGLFLFTLRRLVPRMGLQDLIRAVGRLSSHPRPVHLWVGGTGPDADRLGRLAEEEGGGRVRLLGPVMEEAVPDLYSAADLFVVPSRDLEGFGLATLEALASGTPVIATPAGANPEVISDLDPDLILAGLGPEAIADRLMKAQGGRWCDAGFRARCRQYAAERFPWGRAIDLFESTARCVIRISEDG